MPDNFKQSADVSAAFGAASAPRRERPSFIHGVYNYTRLYIGQGQTVPKPEVDDEYLSAAQETERLLDASENIIFGAVVRDPVREAYVRASALVRRPDGTFDVIKVTTSTKVKPDHIREVSEAYHGFAHAGLKMGRAHVLHINNRYKKEGDISPQAFLKRVDVTAKLKKADQLASAPPPTMWGGREEESPIHHPEQIRTFLDRLRYPLYFLDYETIGPAAPVFEGTHPYQQIPFQFSLHVQPAPGAPLIHHEFLHQEPTDPRRALTEKLVALCGGRGSVLVYFEDFEKARNRELAEAFPEHAEAFHALNGRIVDLYEPFKQRWLYHPVQQGSASIKTVLPAFTDLSYDELSIHKGDVAALEYFSFILGEKSPAEQAQLWEDLRAYCKMDTLAMVSLLAVLEHYSEPRPQVIAHAVPKPAP